jgi:tetratricopeptide (TPR) repeat protein
MKNATKFVVLLGLLCAPITLSSCLFAPSAVELRDKGIAENQVGHLDQARDLLTQSLDKSCDPLAEYWLGRTYHAQGRYRDAICHYKAAIQSKPAYDEAKQWLQKARQDAGLSGPDLD